MTGAIIIHVITKYCTNYSKLDTRPRLCKETKNLYQKVRDPNSQSEIDYLVFSFKLAHIPQSLPISPALGRERTAPASRCRDCSLTCSPKNNEKRTTFTQAGRHKLIDTLLLSYRTQRAAISTHLNIHNG